MAEDRLYASGHPKEDYLKNSDLRKLEERQRELESCQCGGISLKDGKCIHCILEGK